MSYEAKVLADSVSKYEDRLTTLEVTFPRMVLAEFNTHRMFSRNSASSRAIPVEKQISRILNSPAAPVEWGINQPGMRAGNELVAADQQKAESIWLAQRDLAVLGACALAGGVAALNSTDLKERMARLDDRYSYGLSARQSVEPVHKQLVNRLLEPFMWHSVIVTATDWDNFFALRTHADAQPEIRRAALLMQSVRDQSAPRVLESSEYHLPLILEDERSMLADTLAKIAIARCARVSYLTHDGTRDHEKDLELYARLSTGGHMSPLEHVAKPMTQQERAKFTQKEMVWSPEKQDLVWTGSYTHYLGNFQGWVQYRKLVAYEANYGEILRLRE